jgi:hypothetical protein
MNAPRNMTDADRFEKVLEFMSDFFAMEDPRSSFNRVIRDLMECCPQGVIVGGIAVTFYVKNPRTTKDVDIVLLDTASLASRFRERFEPIAGMPSSVRHKETGIEVDLLMPESPLANRALLEQATKHFRLIDRAGTLVRVAAPEMIVGLKLRRALNATPKGLIDRSDILTILSEHSYVDLDSLREHLSEEERDLLDDLLTYRDKLLTGEIHD